MHCRPVIIHLKLHKLDGLGGASVNSFCYQFHFKMQKLSQRLSLYRYLYKYTSNQLASEKARHATILFSLSKFHLTWNASEYGIKTIVTSQGLQTLKNAGQCISRISFFLNYVRCSTHQKDWCS